MIDDILDISKFDQGAFKLQISDFSIKDLIQELKDLFGIQMRGKGIEFTLDTKLPDEISDLKI